MIPCGVEYARWSASGVARPTRSKTRNRRSECEIRAICSSGAATCEPTIIATQASCGFGAAWLPGRAETADREITPHRASRRGFDDYRGQGRQPTARRRAASPEETLALELEPLLARASTRSTPSPAPMEHPSRLRSIEMISLGAPGAGSAACAGLAAATVAAASATAMAPTLLERTCSSSLFAQGGAVLGRGGAAGVWRVPIVRTDGPLHKY